MDKKNTLLLTVIAIATLLVAVIGATFAYFSAQAGAGASANVNVTTSTTDTAMFQGFTDIKIDADQTNFATGEGSLKDSSEGTVTFTSSSASESEKNYCYTVTMTIEKNQFIYSLPKNFNSNSHWPELVLDIWKLENSEKDTVEDIETEMGVKHYTNSFYAEEGKQLSYIANILDNAKVCEDEECSDNDSTIAGYDFTVFGNDKANNYVLESGSKYYLDGTVDAGTIKKVGDQSTPSTETNDFSAIKTIKIPTYSDSYEDFISQKYEHKMTAASKDKKVYDHWKFAVTFVNYTDNDKSTLISGDQNLNTGRVFNAKIEFKPANDNGTCSEEV